MIIRDIYIDGFGILDHLSLPGFSKGVNIVIGRNEAGKSSLQKFINYTLFGYPHLTEFRMAPVKGGVHGGRIRCQLSSGEEAIFERRSGSRGGDIQLQFHGSTSSSAPQWQQLLGNANGDLYKNIYAFSLDELVAVDSLKSSGVEDKIFSVGLGLGSTSLANIESGLSNHVNAIYWPRGSANHLAKLLDEFLQRKKKVQEIQNDLPVYLGLNKDIETLQARLEIINQNLQACRNKHFQLKNFLACYDHFIEAENCRESLLALPAEREYPESGPAALDKLEVRESALLEKIRDLREGTEEEQGLMELEIERNAIVVQDNLLRQQGRITKLVNGLTLYKQKVLDFNEDNGKIKRIKESIRQELQRINPSWDISFIRELGNTILHKDKIAAFRQRQEELDRKKIKLETEEITLAANRPRLNIPAIAITISLALVVLSTVAFIYHTYVPAAALVIIALIVFLRRGKYGSKNDPLQNVRDELKALRDIDEPALQKDYQSYLGAEFWIQGSLSVNAAIEILNNIDGIKKEIAVQDELQARQDNEGGPSILAYNEEAASLKPYLDELETADTVEDLVYLARRKFESAKQDAERKLRLEEAIRNKTRLCGRAESELQENLTSVAKLLAGIGVEDRAAYRKKYADNEEVIHLNEVMNRAIVTIEKIVGVNSFDEVSQFLSTHDKATLDRNIQVLDAEMQILERQVQESNTSIGGKLVERDRIAGESTLAMHLTELEMVRERINQECRSWGAGKIALRILAEVKSKYERERQPAVIKTSENYFSAMTGGKYRRINVSLEEKVVRVYDAMEASKRIEQLSRGTKEQLLISLRLGFIEQYETQSEPLPVIVDEIFVNFDPDRLKATARILHAFAQTRQVLIFTCHPSTKDYFEGMEINDIEL